MPESNRPLVERIARVLAGAAHSSNAEGSDPSASEKVDLVWPEHVNQALAVLTPCASPTRRWPRRRRGRLSAWSRHRPAHRGRRTVQARATPAVNLWYVGAFRRLSGRATWIAFATVIGLGVDYIARRCGPTGIHRSAAPRCSTLGPDGQPVRRRQKLLDARQAGDGRGRRAGAASAGHSFL